jgi:hypothetical protein
MLAKLGERGDQPAAQRGKLLSLGGGGESRLAQRADLAFIESAQAGVIVFAAIGVRHCRHVLRVERIFGQQALEPLPGAAILRDLGSFSRRFEQQLLLQIGIGLPGGLFENRQRLVVVVLTPGEIHARAHHAEQARIFLVQFVDHLARRRDVVASLVKLHQR